MQHPLEIPTPALPPRKDPETSYISHFYISHFYVSVITSLGFVRNQEQLDLEMCPAHA